MTRHVRTNETLCDHLHGQEWSPLVDFFNGQIIFAEKSLQSRVADSIVRSGEPFKAVGDTRGSRVLCKAFHCFLKVLIAIDIKHCTNISRKLLSESITIRSC